MVIGNVSDHDWERIKILIKEVITRRKYKFDKKIILKEIILEMKKNEFTDDFVDQIVNCSYFQIMLLNILDDCVEQGFLYLLNNVYIPFEYAILNEYFNSNYDLLYLSENTYNELNCINVATAEKICFPRNMDYILTGGFDDGDHEKLIVPDIPFEEIYELYKEFIKEGATKKEAINHILNYYKVKKIRFDNINGYYETLKIDRKSKNKTKKINK